MRSAPRVGARVTGGPAGEGSNLGLYWGDDAYAIEYFLEKFVGWTGYQITGAIKEISPHDVRTPR